ncbi:zona pellucida sperm-binding protein 3-like [Osmerus mordax]|uniref:zona pellucida sperm-binding protein 3-like n=1 Tax=Osmerus mordax TaxID=8014 RepID=UPI0035106A62
MAMKWITNCLVVVAVLGYACDGAPQKPQKPNPQGQVIPEPPITWEFPRDPAPDSSTGVVVDVPLPPVTNSVSVSCLESQVNVMVKRDMFGTGQLIKSSDLMLGSCAVSQEIPTDLLFQSDLASCGSHVTMNEESLVYSYLVTYTPTSLPNVPIVRTGKAEIRVECHYQRKHNVSSLAVNPRWIPFSTTRVAEELLYFSLKLMTDDGRFERINNNYIQSDLIRMEASVKRYMHVPLRVYVDNCVATLQPEVNSSPRYVFIGNNGCMLDGRATGSASTFFQRVDDTKLQFQLESFMFVGQNLGQNIIQHGKIPGKTSPARSMKIYITCYLKASTAARPIDSTYKACSFANGWNESNGNHAACACCDSDCGGRKVREVTIDADHEWEATASIAITVGEEQMG